MFTINQITNKLFCGDCVTIMKEFPNESIDLTVTSPPYDNLRTYKGYNFNFEEIAKQLFRIVKIGGVVVWVVGDATINGCETGTSFKQALYFKKIGFNLHDTMIYQKNGSTFPDQNRYYQCFEYMFIFSKGAPKTINLIKDRQSRWKGSWGKKTVRNKNGELVKQKIVVCNKTAVRYNIWKFNTGYGFTTKDVYAYKHPAMFPENLANDHILSWSNPNDIVLDPMCGGGTTLKMAKLNNRNWCGIEISDEYCKIARERIDRAQENERLF